MKGNSDYIFTHATEIAERRSRHARRLQSDEVKRSAMALSAAAGRLIQGLRQVFGQTEQP